MYICMYKKTPFRPSVSFDNVLVNYTFVVIDRAIIDCFGSCILCFFERIIQCTLCIIYEYPYSTSQYLNLRWYLLLFNLSHSTLLPLEGWPRPPPSSMMKKKRKSVKWHLVRWRSEGEPYTYIVCNNTIIR